MRSPVQANSLLALIGAGCHRLSEIGSRVGQPATNLSRPLSRLIDLGYVPRELPFGESTRSTKRSRYRFDDPFLLFWQQMARDSVVRIALHGMRWNPASRWWGKGTGGVPLEIDVVAESVDGRHLLVGEVKWSRRDDAASIRRELAAKAQRLPILRGRNVHYVRALAKTQWLGKCRRHPHHRSGSGAGHRRAQDLSYLSCRRKSEVRMPEAFSESCWSSLSHRWAREAASRLAGKAKSFHRQSRTTRRIQPFHHRHDTRRRTVPDNCRQNTGLRSTIQQSLRIDCLHSLLGLPNGRSHRLLLVRLYITTVPTGERDRFGYLGVHEVPMAASASPVDESSSFKLSDQFPQFPGHRVATLCSVKANATGLPGQGTNPVPAELDQTSATLLHAGGARAPAASRWRSTSSLNRWTGATCWSEK